MCTTGCKSMNTIKKRNIIMTTTESIPLKFSTDIHNSKNMTLVIVVRAGQNLHLQYSVVNNIYLMNWQNFALQMFITFVIP